MNKTLFLILIGCCFAADSFAADPTIDPFNNPLLVKRVDQIDRYAEKANFEIAQRDKAEALFNESMQNPNASGEFLEDINEILNAAEDRARQKSLPNGGPITPQAKIFITNESTKAELAAVENYIDPKTLEPLTAEQKAYMREYIIHRDRAERMKSAYLQTKADTGFEIFKTQKNALDAAAEREYGKKPSAINSFADLNSAEATSRLNAAQAEYNNAVRHIRTSAHVSMEELRLAAQLEKEVEALKKLSAVIAPLDAGSTKLLSVARVGGKALVVVGAVTTAYDLAVINNAEYATTKYMESVKRCETLKTSSVWAAFWGRVKQAGMTIGINTGLDDVAGMLLDGITKGNFSEDVKQELKNGITDIQKNCPEILTELKADPKFVDGLTDIGVRTAANPRQLELGQAPANWWMPQAAPTVSPYDRSGPAGSGFKYK